MHPRDVYVREDAIVSRLDGWLARLFAPHRIDATLDVLVAAARHQVAECDRKLAQHRAALEAGADPVVVAGSIREEQARKVATEARLRRAPVGRRRLTRDDLAEMMHALGGMVQMLGRAGPSRYARPGCMPSSACG